MIEGMNKKKKKNDQQNAITLWRRTTPDPSRKKKEDLEKFTLFQHFQVVGGCDGGGDDIAMDQTPEEDFQTTSEVGRHQQHMHRELFINLQVHVHVWRAHTHVHFDGQGGIDFSFRRAVKPFWGSLDRSLRRFLKIFSMGTAAKV